jgi:hypothetical protein
MDRKRRMIYGADRKGSPRWKIKKRTTLIVVRFLLEILPPRLPGVIRDQLLKARVLPYEIKVRVAQDPIHVRLPVLQCNTK